MEDKKFQVLTAPKVAGVSVEDVTDELVAQYPAYMVEVHEAQDEFVAKLTRKQAAPPKGKVPPFLDEEEGGEAPADIAPKDDAEDAPPEDDDAEGEDKPKSDKKDGDEDEDKEGDGNADLSRALHALDTLKSVLPKLEKQLKSLGGGELPEGLGEGPLGPEGAPAGPDGLGGPSQSDLNAVGPTPGHPTPGNAAPVVPGLGGKGPHPPHPQVGVPTFGHIKQNKFVYRPAFNEDGSQVSMEEATREIAAHPRYAKYDVREVRLDEDGQQYVAHLKLRS